MNAYQYDFEAMPYDSSYGCFILGFKIDKYATENEYSLIGVQTTSTSSLLQPTMGIIMSSTGIVSGIQVEHKIRFRTGYSSMLSSEESLKKEWLTPEEDEAWKDL